MKWITLVVIVLAASVGITANASANVRHCHFHNGRGPVNDRGVQIGLVRAHNMTCSAALSRLTNGRLTRSGNLRTNGFRCRILRSYHAGGVLTGAVIRCTHRTKSFRFSWAT